MLPLNYACWLSEKRAPGSMVMVEVVGVVGQYTMWA